MCGRSHKLCPQGRATEVEFHSQELGPFSGNWRDTLSLANEASYNIANVECQNPEGFRRLIEIENNRELNQSFQPHSGRAVFLRFLISLLIGP